jgi:hypothetical protein
MKLPQRLRIVSQVTSNVKDSRSAVRHAHCAIPAVYRHDCQSDFLLSVHARLGFLHIILLYVLVELQVSEFI